MIAWSGIMLDSSITAILMVAAEYCSVTIVVLIENPNKKHSYCSWTRSPGAYCASAQNLHPIRPFNKLSNGVSHMQINAAVSEI